MKNIIFIGGRANTKIAAEIYKQQQETSIYYFADREYVQEEFEKAGFSLIDNFEIVCEEIINGFEYFVGVGGNQLRQEITENLISKTKINPINIISNRACIASGVTLGTGNLVMQDSIINLNSKVGSGNIFNTKSLVEHDCKIGDYNHIAPSATILGYATVENSCEIFTSSIIFPYRTIKSNVTVGANSTVTKDINVSGKYFGSPARLIDF